MKLTKIKRAIIKYEKQLNNMCFIDVETIKIVNLKVNRAIAKYDCIVYRKDNLQDRYDNCELLLH